MLPPTTTATATVTVSPPSCRILSTATSTAPGVDGIWGNDDDINPFVLVTYSYDDDVATYIAYIDPGTDQLWRTSDDIVVAYGTVFMTDSVEVFESYVKGADGIWFTADDPKDSIRNVDWGPLGKPHPTSIYPYIDSMLYPDGIGPWLSIDMIDSGDDKEYLTSDDFHLLTQNFHDDRGRLVRQESFRGIENQLIMSGKTQFEIDVASKTSMWIEQEKGNDNLFGTEDDFDQADYIYHFTDDAFLEVDYTEALWYLDQSVVTSIDRYYYDVWGHLQKIVTFSYEGDDREWLTQDDVISKYILFLYDEYGIWWRRITYDQPGPDGVWLTNDDVIAEMKLQTYECDN